MFETTAISTLISVWHEKLIHFDLIILYANCYWIVVCMMNSSIVIDLSPCIQEWSACREEQVWCIVAYLQYESPEEWASCRCEFI